MKLWLLTSHSPDGASAGTGTFQVVEKTTEEVDTFLELEGSYPPRMGLELEGDQQGLLLTREVGEATEDGMMVVEGNYLQTIDMVRDMGEGELKFGAGATPDSSAALLAKVAAWD